MHHDHHLPPGLVGLHHAMRLADLLELEDPRWFCLVAPCGDVIRNALKWDVLERKTRGPENEAAEEGQINAARHLQERVEVGDRCEAAEPTREAS